PDAERLQKLADFLRVGNLAVLVLDANAGHCFVSLAKAESRKRKAGFRLSALGFLSNDSVSLEFSRQNHPPGNALEQKLKNFHVPPGFFQVAAPSIEAV